MDECPSAAPSAEPEWLALVANLPTEDPAARMRMLRTLESLGAAVMREGVYLLPATPAARQGLERLAEYIAKSAGMAQVLRVAAGAGGQEQRFRGLFDRSARYGELIKNVEALRLAFGVSDPGAISRVLQKQRREFEAISALDFFPTEMRERAARSLAEGEAAVRALLFPAQAGGAAKPVERLLGRQWATCKPLWADRLACAWLVRRFVDPEATFAWLRAGESAPASSVGFGFEGARFANVGGRVTFEEMLTQLDLAKNPALGRIGAIVHFLEAGGAPVPEAAGVQTLLQGATRRAASDDDLLLEAEKTFDLLYDAYFESPGEVES
jgi:hypothetical protein